MILAGRVPQTPVMNELYKELETNREQSLKMLYTLKKAGLLALLTTQVKSYKNLSRPPKIYLDNPNLMYVLTTNINIGTVRETFFLNQLDVHHNLLFPYMGDFHVDQRYLFEVGGRSKSFKQIKDVPNSFLVVDSTEIGHHNRIPF